MTSIFKRPAAEVLLFRSLKLGHFTSGAQKLAHILADLARGKNSLVWLFHQGVWAGGRKNPAGAA